MLDPAGHCKIYTVPMPTADNFLFVTVREEKTPGKSADFENVTDPMLFLKSVANQKANSIYTISLCESIRV